MGQQTVRFIKQILAGGVLLVALSGIAGFLTLEADGDLLRADVQANTARIAAQDAAGRANFGQVMSGLDDIQKQLGRIEARLVEMGK